MWGCSWGWSQICSCCNNHLYTYLFAICSLSSVYLLYAAFHLFHLFFGASWRNSVMSWSLPWLPVNIWIQFKVLVVPLKTLMTLGVHTTQGPLLTANNLPRRVWGLLPFWTSGVNSAVPESFSYSLSLGKGGIPCSLGFKWVLVLLSLWCCFNICFINLFWIVFILLLLPLGPGLSGRKTVIYIF